MVKKIIISLLVLNFLFNPVITPRSNAFITATLPLLVKMFAGSAKKMAVPLVSSAFGGLFGYMIYNGIEKYIPKENRLPSGNEYKNPLPNTILYNGYQYNKVNEMSATNSSVNHARNVQNNYCFPQTVTYAIPKPSDGSSLTVSKYSDTCIGVASLKNPVTGSPYNDDIEFTIAKYSKGGVDTISKEQSEPPYFSKTNTTGNLTPYQIDLDKSLSENLRDIKDDLLAAGVPQSIVDTITESDVADILSSVPKQYTEKMPNSAVEDAAIDKARAKNIAQQDNLTIPPFPAKDITDAINAAIPKTKDGSIATEQTKPIDIADPAVPAVPKPNWLPAEPKFSDNITTPQQLDFLQPVKDFFTNALSYFPFINMFQSATIDYNSPKSIITFPYKNQNFEYDFSQHSSIFNFMRSVILFCSSILAVFIIVRRS